MVHNSQRDLRYGLNPDQAGARLSWPGASSPLDVLSGNPGTINVESSDLSAVPEPSTLGMLGAGLAGALTLARRKRR